MEELVGVGRLFSVFCEQVKYLNFYKGSLAKGVVAMEQKSFARYL